MFEYLPYKETKTTALGSRSQKHIYLHHVPKGVHYQGTKGSTRRQSPHSRKELPVATLPKVIRERTLSV